jgi:hypothetical protein
VLKRNIARRQFLWLGSVFSLGVFSPIALQSSRSTGIGTAQASEPPTNRDMAIGFWQADQADSEQRLFSAPLVPNIMAADRLRTGDKAFTQRGAKVQIQGVNFSDGNWSDGNWQNMASLAVNVYYPSSASHGEQKVIAWCLQADPVLNLSAPVSFTLPIVESTGLKVSFDRQYKESSFSQAAQVTEVVSHLTLGTIASLPKLQRGVYLFAAQRPTEPLSWEDYRLHVTPHSSLNANSGHKYELLRFDAAQNQLVAADFPCLLIVVDYGDTGGISA